MRHETGVVSILFVAGKTSGADLITHTLSCVSEQSEARTELYRLARSLAKLHADGFLKVADTRDGRMWALTEECSRDWSTEVLSVDQQEH